LMALRVMRVSVMSCSSSNVLWKDGGFCMNIIGGTKGGGWVHLEVQTTWPNGWARL